MGDLATIASSAGHSPLVGQSQVEASGTAEKPLIVVGVDGSAASLDALRWAVKYATLAGGQIEAVTSWEIPASVGLEFGTFDCDWEENARATLEAALFDALGDSADTIGITVRRGRAQQVLVDAARGAELLVVGSRGHGSFVGMLLGSVSEHVIAHAGCPVVVIRHPADGHPPSADPATALRSRGR